VNGEWRVCSWPKSSLQAVSAAVPTCSPPLARCVSDACQRSIAELCVDVRPRYVPGAGAAPKSWNHTSPRQSQTVPRAAGSAGSRLRQKATHPVRQEHSPRPSKGGAESRNLFRPLKAPVRAQGECCSPNANADRFVAIPLDVALSILTRSTKRGSSGVPSLCASG
jgi:hypothetical protein